MLRGRVVDFKHAQALDDIPSPIGKGIEPGAQNDVLCDAVLEGLLQFVFGVPTPTRHLSPYVPG